MIHSLIWLFITGVRQLCSDGLKWRHLVISTFAHAQTLERCISKRNYSRSLHANALMCMSVFYGTRVLICHSSHEFKSFARIDNIQYIKEFRARFNHAFFVDTGLTDASQKVELSC